MRYLHRHGRVQRRRGLIAPGISAVLTAVLVAALGAGSLSADAVSGDDGASSSTESSTESAAARSGGQDENDEQSEERDSAVDDNDAGDGTAPSDDDATSGSGSDDATDGPATGDDESSDADVSEGDSDEGQPSQGESTEEPASDDAATGDETDDGATGDETPGTDATPGDDSGSDEGADADRSPEPRSTDDGAISPMSIPSPDDTTAVINVNVGGDRDGSTSVAALAGVTLRLYTGGSGGPNNPVNEDWAECVSDADGDCSFEVPQTQPEIQECDGFVGPITGICHLGSWVTVQEAGDNHDARFWVVQESAPSGWYANDELVTGTSSSNGARDYAFRTPGLEAGEVYESGNHFMEDDGNRTSSGIWQNARNNPQLPLTCDTGLRVALILDLSGSVANAGAVGDLRESAKGFVDALAGTGSSIGLYTFAEYAPRNNGSSGRNYPIMAIDSGNNQQTINNRIDDYSAGGGTNWDRGIWQVANDSTHYDLAIMVTDGLATFYGPNASGPGNNTRFVETEQAIYSANALKADGTRVLAVGVGGGISGDAHNLAAVSGPTPYQQGSSANNADYFQAGWQELGPLLSDLARGATCQATVSVTKLAQEYGGATADPAAGWTFEAARTAGSGTITPSATQTTGASGTVDYRVIFPTTSATATLRLTELPTAAQQGQGWAIESVTCTVNGTSRPVTLTGESVSLTGITRGDSVACTFLNAQQLVPDIEIVKQAWGTTDASGLPGADELPAGSEITSGTVITWTYEVSNTGQTPLTDVDVTDDQLPGGVTCPSTTLAVGASMTCTASGPVTALP